MRPRRLLIGRCIYAKCVNVCASKQTFPSRPIIFIMNSVSSALIGFLVCTAAGKALAHATVHPSDSKATPARPTMLSSAARALRSALTAPPAFLGLGGYNNRAVAAANLDITFHCPPPLGSHLVPHFCPPKGAKVNWMRELFRDDLFHPLNRSQLYCPAGISSLARMDLKKKEGVVNFRRLTSTQFAHAVKTLMHLAVRLHGNYRPWRMQRGFNECMQALQSISSFKCKTKPCTAKDIKSFQKRLLAEDSKVKRKCLTIPTMKTQLVHFFVKLADALQNPIQAVALQTASGLTSALRTAAGSASASTGPPVLLSDSIYDAAFEKVGKALIHLRDAKPTQYNALDKAFAQVNGNPIHLLDKSAQVPVFSKVRVDDFKIADGIVID